MQLLKWVTIEIERIIVNQLTHVVYSFNTGQFICRGELFDG